MSIENVLVWFINDDKKRVIKTFTSGEPQVIRSDGTSMGEGERAAYKYTQEVGPPLFIARLDNDTGDLVWVGEPMEWLFELENDSTYMGV